MGGPRCHLRLRHFALTKRHPYSLEGKTLLVLGASGGIGTAAIELGKALGAGDRCSVHTRKFDFCAERRADHCVSMRRDSGLLKSQVCSDGCDVVLIQSRLSHLGKLSVHEGGCNLLCIGFAASQQIPRAPLDQLLQRNIGIIGVWAYSKHFPEEMQAFVADVIKIWLEKKLAPSVSTVLLSVPREGLERSSAGK